MIKLAKEKLITLIRFKMEASLEKNTTQCQNTLYFSNKKTCNYSKSNFLYMINANLLQYLTFLHILKIVFFIMII